MAGVTTYDCLMRSLAKPEQQQAFFSNPNSLHDPYHLTPTDAHEVYDAVDPLKNPKLSQEGKVVFITGANRGIGRVSLVTRSRFTHEPSIVYNISSISQL